MPSEIAANSRVAPQSVSASAGPTVAVAVRNLGKCYRIYRRPQDRLKQALWRGRKRYFREFWALRGVSLEVRRGETVGIMGRNGCGKSTLLQTICGTLTPTTGQIEIHGRIAALLELGAGFNPEFSGRDNVYLNGAILGLSRDEIDARYDDIVAFAELGEFIDRPVKMYSSGMHVRLAFAVAASIEPDILVVDEALAVGDEAFQRKCFARIEAIKQRGGTILFVSHAAALVTQLCDRAVLLDRGELLMTGRPKTVVAKYHQLLYAPAIKTESVREEIRLASADSTSSLATSGASPARPQVKAEAARFDLGLKPKSTVVYERRGAEIFNPRITTLAGQQVNVLVPHEEYLIRYGVRFTAPAYQVLWGTTLKTTEGMELSMMSVPRWRREFVSAGCEAHQEFRFRCLLMPGIYFANVGVFGVVDGEEGYLHRVTDALIFRVLDGNHRTTSGKIDLFVDSRTVLKNAEVEEAA